MKKNMFALCALLVATSATFTGETNVKPAQEGLYTGAIKNITAIGQDISWFYRKTFDAIKMVLDVIPGTVRAHANAMGSSKGGAIVDGTLPLIGVASIATSVATAPTRKSKAIYGLAGFFGAVLPYTIRHFMDGKGEHPVLYGLTRIVGLAAVIFSAKHALEAKRKNNQAGDNNTDDDQ